MYFAHPRTRINIITELHVSPLVILHIITIIIVYVFWNPPVRGLVATLSHEYKFVLYAYYKYKLEYTVQTFVSL